MNPANAQPPEDRAWTRSVFAAILELSASGRSVVTRATMSLLCTDLSDDSAAMAPATCDFLSLPAGSTFAAGADAWLGRMRGFQLAEQAYCERDAADKSDLIAAGFAALSYRR